MKTSDTNPARKQREQKNCQYIDPETGKICGRALLGQGRLSQGRRYFCPIHSQEAEEASRKQNGPLWVRKSRQQRPDLEVLRNQKRSFANKLLSRLDDHSSFLSDAAEFLEFCDVNRTDIVRWEREERLFAYKMLDIGYPEVHSSALVFYNQQLVQPINGKLSISYLYILHMNSFRRPTTCFNNPFFRRYFGLPDLPKRGCNPSHSFYKFNIVDEFDKLQLLSGVLDYDCSRDPDKQSQPGFNAIIVRYSPNSYIVHSVTLTKLLPYHAIYAEGIYKQLVNSCPPSIRYPFCLIHSIRDLPSKKREIIVSTVIGPTVGQGRRESGTSIELKMSSYQFPPFLDEPLDCFCLDFRNTGFQESSQYTHTVVLYHGEEKLNGRMKKDEKE